MRHLLIALLTIFALGAPLARADQWDVRLGGCTFTAANFAGNRYADDSPCGGFRPAIRAMLDEVNAAWLGTSGTSLTIGTGTQSLVLTTGRGFAPGQPVRIASTADPTTDFMDGTITSWDPADGSMEVDVDAVAGSGTLTSWSVYVMRSETTFAGSPVPIADGGTGADTARGAQAALGVAPIRTVELFSATPESSPSTGRVYLVGSSATGAWSGHDGEWARWNGSSWTFEAAVTGDVAIVDLDEVSSRIGGGTIEGTGYRYNGTSWQRWLKGVHDTVALAGSGGSLTIGANDGPAREVVRLRKAATGTHTLTLPSAPGAAPSEVLVINDSASGDITVNVASAGTIDGSASLTVSPGTSKRVVWAGSSGKWHSL